MTLTPMLPVEADALPQQPIRFNEELHKYFWEPTQQVMEYSVTTVLSHFKSAKDLANIESYRASWEPRGLAVHGCLEQWAKGEAITPGDYQEWVDPLLAHPFWKEFTPIASEYRMCDLARSLGGSCDLIGRWRGKTLLLDLKTQGYAKAQPYSTDAQLGAYLQMLLGCTSGLWIDELRTIWCRPGKTVIGKDQGIDECSVKFSQLWEQFIADQQEDTF